MSLRLFRRAPALLLLGGCAALTPAHLQTPTPDCLMQLEAFIGQQTDRAVQLDARSFTQSDTLQLQSSVFRDAQGRPLDGRNLGRPEVFRLLQGAGACMVEHAGSGARAKLDACSCSATGLSAPEPVRSHAGSSAA